MAKRMRCLLYTSQNGLERGKVVVVGGKAQVVDEQDEFERVRGQFVHQIRDCLLYTSRCV